jgi:hypothetical protein
LKHALDEDERLLIAQAAGLLIGDPFAHTLLMEVLPTLR